VSNLLRVDPQRLTAVREAYDKALSELRPQLDDLAEAGHIKTPWLGDSVSNEVKDTYNRVVMASKSGTYQAMVRYEIELTAIRDHIADMEKAYLAGDSAIAERTPRMA
jgi:hypothetical protein